MTDTIWVAVRKGEVGPWFDYRTAAHNRSVAQYVAEQAAYPTNERYPVIEIARAAVTVDVEVTK